MDLVNERHLVDCIARSLQNIVEAISKEESSEALRSSTDLAKHVDEIIPKSIHDARQRTRFYRLRKQAYRVHVAALRYAVQNKCFDHPHPAEVLKLLQEALVYARKARNSSLVLGLQADLQQLQYAAPLEIRV